MYLECIFRLALWSMDYKMWWFINIHFPHSYSQPTDHLFVSVKAENYNFMCYNISIFSWYALFFENNQNLKEKLENLSSQFLGSI